MRLRSRSNLDTSRYWRVGLGRRYLEWQPDGTYLPKGEYFEAPKCGKDGFSLTAKEKENLNLEEANCPEWEKPYTVSG